MADVEEKMRARELLCFDYTDGIIGICTDGKVVSCFPHHGSDVMKSKFDIPEWKDIIAISIGWNHVLGLKEDGTVLAHGDNRLGQCNVNDWTDIISISTGKECSVGLRSDGTVIAVGVDSQNIETWKDIIQVICISSGIDRREIIVALKKDGSVITGSKWDRIYDYVKDFSTGVTVHLFSDGEY